MANYKKKITGEIAREYLLKYPNHPTKTIADAIYKDNPEVFTDAEHARATVRYYRGEVGEKQRQKNKSDKLINPNKMKVNEIELPKSWANERKVWHMPKGYKNIGFISDLQAPFHCEKALVTTVSYLKKQKIDALFMNGDMVDFYGLSPFEQDPRKRNFKAERDECEQILRWIRSQFKCPIYYNLDANHEMRYERYMKIKAPVFFSTDMFHIEELFRLHDIGIIPLRGYCHYNIGKLSVVHGHTVFKKWGSVNAAKTVFDKLITSSIVSHVHKVNQYTRVDLKGKVIGCWTTGCLMNLNVEYNPHGNDYTHGFARIEILSEDGDFRVNNHMIINGEVH